MSSTETLGNQKFPPTRWSLLLEAQGVDSVIRREALEGLCRAYWQPLYTYVRYRGHNPEDAEDLIQGFFAGLLARDGLRHVDEAKGKLRTFLLVSLNHHISDGWKAATRIKRGGGSFPLPIDIVSAEDRFRSEIDEHFSPEKIYDYQWALALIDSVLGRLRQSYTGEGNEPLFEALKDVLVRGDGGPSYQEIAASLGKSESAIKTAVHRMRKRFRKLLMEEISRTLEDGADAEDEVRYLIEILSRRG